MKEDILAIVLLGLYAKSIIALDICENQRDGARLAHPGDCSKFVVCEREKTALISSCPTGLHFSRQSGECDFKDRAGCQLDSTLPNRSQNYAANDDSCCTCCNCNCCNCCSNGITLCKGKPDGSTISVTGNSSQYYECNGGCATVISCENGWQYNATTGECESSNTGCSNGITVCEGKPDGSTISVTGNSSQYYECNGGCATINSCENGWQYNATTGECESSNTGCSNGITVCEGKPDGSTIFVTGNSSQYYECNGGCATINSCENGWQYNATTGECESSNTGCSNGITVCEGKPDGSTISVTGNSSQYYECNGGCATINSCENGWQYNATTGECESSNTGCSNGITVCEGKPDGSTISVTGNSSQYYECNGGCATVISCENGWQYNATTGECELSNTGCANGITVCEGKPDGSTISVTGNSSQYYECNGGCATINSCENGWQYNATTGECESSNTGCSNGITVCEGKPDGSTIFVTGNSSQYYECNGGCATINSCENGWQYNATTGECESSNTGCSNGITVCEGKPDGSTISVTGNSSQYYECNGGCATVISCENGWQYNATTGECELSNTGCANGITVCEGKPDGSTISVTGNSSQYYECNGGCATINSCENGWQYNATTGECESSSTGCSNGITVCEGKPDGSTISVTGNSSQYYECNGGCATVISCENGWQYNATTGECELSNTGCANGITVCEGKPDGSTISVTGNSIQYYECNGGCATINSCENGWQYNSTTGECESSNTGCSNGITVCEGKPDGSTISVTGNSSQYYECNGGCATIKSCDNGLEYNPLTGECESNDVEGPSTGPSGTACVSGGKCVGQPDGTLFPDSSSSGYIVCQCECEIARPCPDGLVFNPAVNVCDWPKSTASGNDVPAGLAIDCNNDSDACKNQDEGTLLPVEGVCNKFFKCNFGCAVEIECPNNLIYNTNGQYCDYPQNVKCAWPYSPPSGPSAGPSGIACDSGGRCVGQQEGALLASTTGCGKYVVCRCECEVEMDCPIGLYFDSVNKVCHYPEKVQCS